MRYTFEDVIAEDAVAGGRAERPSHVETGIIRVTDEGALELFSAQTGRTEVLTGSAQAGEGGVELALASSAVGNDDRIAATRRLFRIGGDTLDIRSWLTLASTPEVERHHTTISLKRG